MFILFKFIRRLRESDEATEAAKQETDGILATVREGLFLLDADFRIGTQYSKSLGTLLDWAVAPGDSFIDYLRRNLDKRHDIDSLAGYAGMSRRTLTRHFIKATGMTVGDWLSAQRLQRSQELLETTDHSIEVVSSLAGYQSPVSFRQSFKARYNVSPSEWRRTFRGPGLM